jgi:hypothetical protein
MSVTRIYADFSSLARGIKNPDAKLATLARFLFFLLISLPLYAADKVTWQEEVMLSSQETLIVERIVRRQSLHIGWETNSIAKEHVIRFQDPAGSKQTVEWRSTKLGGPAGIYPEFPLVLDKARDDTWFIYTRVTVISAPCFRYSKYQFKEGKWSEVDLPLDIETRKPNLYLAADRKKSGAIVSLFQKAAEKDDPFDPHFLGQVGPKKYRCFGDYVGPYPPIERPFR